jgi:outer membrane receptor protein involved in Fe transport
MKSINASTLCNAPLKLSALAVAIAVSLSSPFQQASAQASGDEQKLEEVVVTGSRIRQRDDYVSANPVSTFDAQKMESLGLLNISDVITQVPQNVSQFQASTTGGSAFFIGSTLANLRGLNPFFGTRTLTLVDSRKPGDRLGQTPNSCRRLLVEM